MSCPVPHVVLSSTIHLSFSYNLSEAFSNVFYYEKSDNFPNINPDLNSNHTLSLPLAFISPSLSVGVETASAPSSD